MLYVTEFDQLDRFRSDWNRLANLGATYFPAYDDARADLVGKRWLAVVEGQEGGARGIACFANQPARDRFSIGERHLFSVRVRETRLYGGNILGQFEHDHLSVAIGRALSEWPSDLFTIGEVDQNSPLIGASRDLSGLMRIRATSADPIHWLVPLPASFDEYLASLRPSTRKSIVYAMRRFERDCDFTHELATEASQIEEFLCAAERISRKTYQWDVGDRLINDEATRDLYRRLAEQGRFQGHVLCVDGEPCAFSHGQISGRTFLYRTPGFDPRWRRYSPGLVLLALTIRDVIDHIACERFDFGVGGDTEGYKARFGTLAIPSTSLQFARFTEARGFGLVLAHGALSLAKNAANTVLRNPRLRQRMKKMIRRYDSGA